MEIPRKTRTSNPFTNTWVINKEDLSSSFFLQKSTIKPENFDVVITYLVGYSKKKPILIIQTLEYLKQISIVNASDG